MKKLYLLLKLLNASNTSNLSTPTTGNHSNNNSNELSVSSSYVTTRDNIILSTEFVNIMKNQTMLISVMICSTLLSWTLQMIVPGYLFMMTDIVSTIIVIFLTFKFNRYYFILLKCDKCSNVCCKWIENKIIKSITKTMNEQNIINDIQLSSKHVTLPSNTLTPKPQLFDYESNTVDTNDANTLPEIPRITPNNSGQNELKSNNTIFGNRIHIISESQIN